jgi:hypothetical protein
MCSEKHQGSPSEVLQNLRQPMPLGRKIKLVLKNTWIKISHRSDCCGHYGEPGC